MATVFMKWLETRPRDYARGIRLLTLGRLARLHTKIAERWIQPGERVLDLGCGTGDLVLQMAARGAAVTALDVSAPMLAEAKRCLEEAGFADRVRWVCSDAAMLEERFEPESFETVVASLLLSELPGQARLQVLRQIQRILAPDGRLILVDEVRPRQPVAAVLYLFLRIPLCVLTWLLTRTTTHPLRDLERMLDQAGFRVNRCERLLWGSLLMMVADPKDVPPGQGQTLPVLGRLQHRVDLRTLALDLWGLFLRILPPYPKVEPGLYRLGNPGPESPVLATGNFDLTVRRLIAPLDGRVDAWVLVVNSSGINVWCAAGGGFLTAERVIGAIHASGLESYLRRKCLILPQLCANGVDGWKIRRETGWEVHWGPVRAADIPAYLRAEMQKTDSMRWVRFPMRDRLEMMAVTLGFYGLLILLPVAVFWPLLFRPVLLSLVGLSTFYAIAMPWLPGRDGLAKSLPLAVISLLGLGLYTWLVDPAPASSIFARGIGLAGLSVFVAAELQGMSPLMRGEQANWGWEAVIGAALGLAYWLVPRVFGWR